MCKTKALIDSQWGFNEAVKGVFFFFSKSLECIYCVHYSIYLTHDVICWHGPVATLCKHYLLMLYLLMHIASYSSNFSSEKKSTFFISQTGMINYLQGSLVSNGTSHQTYANVVKATIADMLNTSYKISDHLILVKQMLYIVCQS